LVKPQISIRRQFPILLLLLAAAALLWFGQDKVGKVFAAFTASENAQSPSKGRAERSVPVVVQRVGKMTNDAAIETIATARANRFITLFPEAAGEVIFIGVAAGDRITRGHVILRLESRAARLAVDIAKVRLADAKRKYDRSEQLLRQNVNARATVDDDRAAVKRAGLALAQAEDVLAKRTIRAPFSGVVGIPKVEVGDRVTTTKEIVTLDDRRDLLVEVEVPEQFLTRLKIGRKVHASTPGFANRRFEGAVHQIDSRIDPASRNVMVRVRFPNQNDLLRPGMSFAVEIKVPGRAYPSVSELALQWNVGSAHVWRISNGKAEKVKVRSVRRFNSMILVDGDLAPGDLVVVEGVQRLRPGRKVQLIGGNAKTAN
jgi:RND family efflux transporter MFP subunit